MASLRILSINLLVDRADPADLDRVLAAVRPDVVAAQELGRTNASVIEAHLPHGRLDPRSDFFGMGIAARRPITVRRLDLEGRSGWSARLDPDAWSGLSLPLDVIDVHLVNPVDRPWSVSRRTRRNQIAGIRRFLDDRDAASVVIGDMNASPAWREYELLSRLGVDAARATGTARRTWSYFLRGPRLLRIDHAFVRGATPTATSTVRVARTDHRALVVDLTV